MSYEEKYISVEKALSFVKSDDVIVTGLGAAEAGLFMGQLHTIADRVRNVTVTNCLPTHPSQIYLPEYVDSFNVDGWFFAPNLRKAHIWVPPFCAARLPMPFTWAKVSAKQDWTPRKI